MNTRPSRTHRLRASIIVSCAFALAAIAAAATARDARKNGVGGNNEQIVVVKGSVANTADAGATARVNVGVVKNARVGGNNKQTVVVHGSIVNTAKGRGSRAEVNIGSVGTDTE